MLRKENRYGADPVDCHQAGAAPGPKPRRDPPHATEDSSAHRNTRVKQSNATGNPLIVTQWNAEGLQRKKEALQAFIKTTKADIICIQETHLNENMRFSIRGFESFRMDRKGHKGGILTLIRNTIPSIETSRNSNEAEHLTVKLLLHPNPLWVTNYYCPSTRKLNLQEIQILNSNHIIVGDFNSHSPSWGYPSLDSRGEEVEEWITDNTLVLINRPEDEPTFFSRVWRTESSPDIAIATEDIQRTSERKVTNQLGGSDHKPVIIMLQETHSPSPRKKMASWNYKKANWSLF